jgi:hypothetical protein
MQTPPTLAAPYVQITLRNGGWDSQTAHQFSETDPNIVASRVAECIPYLCTADAGITLASNNLLAIIQRETKTFGFMAMWKDLRNDGAQSVSLLFPDDGKVILEWAANVGRMFAQSYHIEQECRRLAKIAADRGNAKAAEERAAAVEQFSEYVVPPTPPTSSAQPTGHLTGVPFRPSPPVGVY